jgi:hypothetical protein
MKRTLFVNREVCAFILNGPMVCRRIDCELIVWGPVLWVAKCAVCLTIASGMLETYVLFDLSISLSPGLHISLHWDLSYILFMYLDLSLMHLALSTSLSWNLVIYP